MNAHKVVRPRTYTYAERRDAHSAYSLYVHIPFCSQKCGYCDFASWPYAANTNDRYRYLAAVRTDIQQLASWGLLCDVQTAYIGGGTPTCLGSKLPELISSIAEFCSPVEFSCEANPDSTSDELLAQLAQSPLTRISFGVQSCHERELRALGRTHTARQALSRLRCAATQGLCVSCDLMCAIPYQTPASWYQSLVLCCEQGISHISIYPLAIEPHTAFWKRYSSVHPAFNNDLVQAARMKAAARILQEIGFARYEVASYARVMSHDTHSATSAQVPLYACAHNRAYWTQESYMGVGTSAASMLTAWQYDMLRKHMPQLPERTTSVVRVRITVNDSRAHMCAYPGWQHRNLTLEFFNEEQCTAEDLMLQARCTCGIEPDLLTHAYDVFGTSTMDALLEELEHFSLIVRADGRILPTEAGWLMGNALFERLWGLAQEPPFTLHVSA